MSSAKSWSVLPRGFVLVTGALVAIALTSCRCKKPSEPVKPRFVVHTPKPLTRKQEDTLVCWAAGAEVLTNGQLEQCVSASDRANGQGARQCCDGKWPPATCNVRGWPRLRGHGYSYSVRTKGWPKWQEMSQELAEKRSMALTLIYPCGARTTSHMKTLIGVATVDDQNFVEIYDPANRGTYTWGWHADGQPLYGEDPYREGRAYYHVTKPEAGSEAQCSHQDRARGDADVCAEDPDLEDALNAFAKVEAPAPSADALRSEVSKADAIQHALAIVRELGAHHPESLGFSSSTEAASAVLVDPSQGRERVFMSADDPALCSQQPGNCESCENFQYRVKRAIVGWLEVGLVGGQWRVTRMGGDEREERIAEISRDPQYDKLGPGESRKLVTVPLLNEVYVEVKQRNGTRGFVSAESVKQEDFDKVLSLDQVQRMVREKYLPKPGKLKLDPVNPTPRP